MKTFEELGLNSETLALLKKKGFEEPTPIQAQAIPVLLKGDQDIVGQSQTGTGKTAAFGLPILEIMDRSSKDVQALILTPTRELAIQVAEEISSFKGKGSFKIIPIYGGQSIDRQFNQLKKNVGIIVGTPGRVMDHLRRKTLKLDSLTHFVLDEADEMLDMGFLDDVKEIMRQTNDTKRTVLFSATMPSAILRLIKNELNDYKMIKITQDTLTVSQTNQIYFEVSRNNKFDALCRIIDIEKEFYSIVFCRTKMDVDTVTSQLQQRGYDADGLHGDMSQVSREKILNKFKKRVNTILIATDVAARGIDVQDLTHVINYALPQDSKSYIHRIGRTGRAGKEGNAITFVTPDEYRKLQYIKRSTNTDIKKGNLPKVKDLRETKKRRVFETLTTIMSETPKEEFIEMAQMLLNQNSPEDSLAMLLEYSFKDALATKHYREIEDVVIDIKGSTKLFITHGQKDGLTKAKLSSLIKTKCNINDDKIRGMEILDAFSFVTLPFQDAEKLLSHFKKKGPRSELTVIKAKAKPKPRHQYNKGKKKTYRK